MSNQDNDQDSFDTDLGFEDGQETGAKKNNPLIKIGLIAVGLVVVLVAILNFGGSKDQTPQSAVGNVPTDNATLPAQQEPTPQYREAMDVYNQQTIDQAKEEGTSAIPIPIDPSRKQIETKISESKEDPAERFRRIQEEYRKQQQQQQVTQQGEQATADAQARAQAVQQLSQGMSAYLTQALNTREPKGSSDLTLNYYRDQNDANADGINDSAQQQALANNLIKPRVILPATTIEYGQLIIEANTDAPGPVLALMVTGRLAGSRLLGSFEETDEYLTIQFNTLVTKDGKSIDIQAIVLDPDTTLPGVITEIDHKYFQRIIIPAAANFISGVGDALAQTQEETTSTTTSTTSTKDEPDFSEAIAEGITDSFDGVADVLEEDAGQVKKMLRVAAGTPIGILFTQDVLDPDDSAKLRDQMQAQAAEQAKNNPYGAGLPGMMMGAVPYTQYPGYAGQPGMAPVPAAAQAPAAQ